MNSPHSKSRIISIQPDAMQAMLNRAKAKERRDERGAAYHELLREFHRCVLPAFIQEAGSVSKASQLLGLNRATLGSYLDMAGLDKKRSGGAA